MIITMDKRANIVMIEHVVSTLQKRGFDVLVKNGQGEVLIAALGLGQIDDFTMGRLVGVKGIDKSNELFNSANGGGFIEAYEFFARYDERKDKK